MNDETLSSKRCPRCERTLAIDCFGRDRATSSGLRVYCKDCSRAIGATRTARPAWREKRRQAGARAYRAARYLLDEIKSRPCEDCGGVYPPYVMQYDHIDPSKGINILDSSDAAT